MKNKNYDQSTADFQEELLQIANSKGREDGIQKQPNIENPTFPQSFTLINSKAKTFLSWLDKELSPALNVMKERSKNARVKLQSQEKLIEEKHGDLENEMKMETSVGKQERDMIKERIDRIPNEIKITRNDQIAFKNQHYNKISLPLIPLWVALGIATLIGIADVSLLVGSITSAWELTFFEGLGIVILPFLGIVFLPHVNALYLKGHFRELARSRFLFLCMLIVGNLMLLSSLAILFYLRAENLVTDTSSESLSPENMKSVLVGVAYLSFLINSVLAFISTPNKEGKEYLAFDKQIKELNKEFSKLKKNITQLERRSVHEIRKQKEKINRTIERLVGDKYTVASKELTNIQNYHAELAKAKHLYQTVNSIQREAFIIYLNTNKSFRDTPMPQYTIDELMEQFALYNPFESYPDQTDLEQAVILHLNQSKRGGWRRWGAAAASFCFSVLFLFSSCASEPRIEKNIHVIVDGTERTACNNLPSIEEIVAEITDQSPNSKEITGNYGNITYYLLSGMTGYNEFGEASLSDPTEMWHLQKALTKKKQNEFYEQVDRIQANLCDTIVGAKQSRIFSNVCAILNNIAREQKSNTTIFVCSDLIEYSDLYNSYKFQGAWLVQEEAKKIERLFQDRCSLPTLSNVEIIIRNKPKNRPDDAKYAVFAEIYRKLLERSGATVSIKS